MSENNSSRNGKVRRLRFGLVLVFLGLLVFIFGAEPVLFGMDRSPVLGFVQITVFLFGLGMVCLGGFITLNALWGGRQKTIAADFGLRLVSTGFVIAVFSGMADVFGFGNHPFPLVPYFGPWQAIGVMAGQIIILIGFILMVPYPGRKN